MKQSKSRNTKSVNPKNTKSIATETMDFDNPEIVKLQEQIRLLQLENNILKQNLEELEKKVSDNVTSQIIQGTSQPRPKSTNIGKSNCACKGNCSSRICGCVKKNNKCNSSCKCNNASCQNQEMKHNDENKENIDESDIEVFKKQIKRTRRRDATKEQQKKNKEIAKETKCIKTSLSPKEYRNSEVTFDPMKPRHQLSRTPPNMKKTPANEISIQKDDTIEFESQPCHKSIEETIIISPNTQGVTVREQTVDWEQHTAQLVPCKKCKRTFMPDRIQKHEACCKKI